ncbi:unnamed protein product [Protopolystoma xenopodis]|uniref:Uncharacterized protein n=1 Tax=Protopolystoma xenopodis TaxID=117903 RepID=A0A3S5CMQ1_9PLAT|nr:unnamed protein product [Protopolystoma xenopodis]
MQQDSRHDPTVGHSCSHHELGKPVKPRYNTGLDSHSLASVNPPDYGTKYGYYASETADESVRKRYLDASLHSGVL